MYYFKFEIPKMPDGQRIAYSPGWHGAMAKCPKKVTVLMYNDRDGYGIAKTEDTFIPPEVEVITEAEAQSLLALPDADGIYRGDKLLHRWDVKEEPPVAEAPPVEEKDEAVEAVTERQVLDSYVKFCPKCHTIVARVVVFEGGTLQVWQDGRRVLDNVKAANLVLNCPFGHKVKVVSDGK